MTNGSIVRWAARGAAAIVVAAALSGCRSEGNRPQEAVAKGSQAVSNAPVSSAVTAGSTGLELRVLTNTCGANQVEDFFEVVNNGTTDPREIS
jgi:hypothetical protein